jgi:hypothetical protein
MPIFFIKIDALRLVQIPFLIYNQSTTLHLPLVHQNDNCAWQLETGFLMQPIQHRVLQ